MTIAPNAIIYDNGSKFDKHKAVDHTLDSPGYFARTFCSSERGLNENTNGMIRQYLPKRNNLDHVPTSKINRIMERSNNRVRKTLKRRTTNEVFFRGSRKARTT